MTVTLTCRSETHAKHPFCLGKTGKAPPTPDLAVPEYYPPVVAYADAAGVADTATSASQATTAKQLGGIYTADDIAALRERVRKLENPQQ